MARPRVFISSTYYDLKHVRSAMESFVESLGFESILFEKGDISFDFQKALDESCYREVQTADIFVLIIGGRYGSAASSDRDSSDKSFYKQYNSITKSEFDRAQASGIPTFILIDGAVHSEYETYKRNKGNNEVNYAHVESVNVFSLIEDIYAKIINAPVHKFERVNDITTWLREQWVGLFKNMLQEKVREKQFGELAAQVNELKAANETMKNYLEILVKKAAGPDSSAIIAHERQEEKRKIDISGMARRIKNSEGSPLYDLVLRNTKNYEDAVRFFLEPSSEKEVNDRFASFFSDKGSMDWTIILQPIAQEHYNDARKALGIAEVAFGKTTN